LRPALGVFDGLEWSGPATVAPLQELSWDINLGVYAGQEAAGLEPWTATTGDEAAKRVEALIAVSKSISDLVFPSRLRERVEEFRQSDEGAMLLPWFWVPQELHGHVPQSRVPRLAALSP
jgi:hypothetical protein